MARFETPQLQSFDFNADPDPNLDPVFDRDADPDPASALMRIRIRFPL
jgi:hypothetical protein